jgi:hypothetical protein
VVKPDGRDSDSRQRHRHRHGRRRQSLKNGVDAPQKREMDQVSRIGPFTELSRDTRPASRFRLFPHHRGRHDDPKDRGYRDQPETGNALITHEKKGDEIHYSRHDAATGALQTLAFVDQGKQLDAKDWKNPETVLVALQVASTKWQTITVNGNDAHKETAARLAAEHGFKITNPEMQDRIQALRAVAESKKSLLAEGAPEAEKTHARPAPAITTTPAERSLHLASIRERVDLEAERETPRAGAAAKADEPSKAESDAATPTRAPQEAAAAREAARTVDSDKSTPMQPNPSQSEEMQQLRHQQQRVLTQEQRDRQELAIRNREAFREQQSRKTENESEGQSE